MTALAAQLEARWRVLSSALWTLERDVESHGWWLPESAAGAWRTRAAGLRATCNRLSPAGELTALALNAGDVTRWNRVADTLRDGLNALRTDLGEDELLPRVWAEIVQPTAQGVADLPRQAADAIADVAAKSNVTLGLVGVVLGLWLLNKVVR